MEKHFKKRFALRASDFDQFDHLLPSTILDFMQDVAGNHADELGVGYHEFLKKGYYWIVIRNRYDVIELPKMFDEVLVETWCKPKGKIDFDREYEIYSLDGKLLIKGVAKWVVISTTRRMLIPARSIDYPEIYDTKANYDSLNKLEVKKDLLNTYDYQTTYCDVDHNGHVNNINYAKYILNALNLSEKDNICGFEIDYEKELHPLENVHIRYQKFDNAYYANGYKDNGELAFIARVTLK